MNWKNKKKSSLKICNLAAAAFVFFFNLILMHCVSWRFVARSLVSHWAKALRSDDDAASAPGPSHFSHDHFLALDSFPLLPLVFFFFFFYILLSKEAYSFFVAAYKRDKRSDATYCYCWRNQLILVSTSGSRLQLLSCIYFAPMKQEKRERTLASPFASPFLYYQTTG